jgi:LmbE family N-acetylglucosaminyl deacetylase
MKILNIFAHFDDAEIWAGGTLLKHAERGDKIFTIVNDVECSPKFKESLKAHAIFDGRLIADGILTKEKIEQTINEIEPDIIITHRMDDSNPEHKELFDLVMVAIITPWINKSLPKQLLTTDSYSSRGLNGIFNPSIYIDISNKWGSNKVL